MKIVFVFLSVVVGLSFAGLKIPEHLAASLRQLRKACIAQTNVDEKYINQTKNGYVPDVPELKCYILCLLEYGGAIDENGTIDFGVVMHLFTPEYRDSINTGMQQCATKHGETRCETAWLTIKCYHELMPEDAELP